MGPITQPTSGTSTNRNAPKKIMQNAVTVDLMEVFWILVAGVAEEDTGGATFEDRLFDLVNGGG